MGNDVNETYDELDAYADRLEGVVPSYGIDPITIITILLPLMLEMIKNCQDDPDKIAGRLTKRDWLSQMMVRNTMRRYVRQIEGPRAMVSDLVEASHQHCIQLGEQGLGKLLGGVKREE